jgi:hypothetical protein
VIHYALANVDLGDKPDVPLNCRGEVTECPATCDRALCVSRNKGKFVGGSITQGLPGEAPIDSQKKAAWHLTFELCHRHSQECLQLALARGRSARCIISRSRHQSINFYTVLFPNRLGTGRSTDNAHYARHDLETVRKREGFNYRFHRAEEKNCKIL